MSLESLTQFFQEQGQDPSVQQQLESATDQDSLVNKMVEIGQQKGYIFTPKEAAAWVNLETAQAQTQSGAEGELSEQELESVAGGFLFFPVRKISEKFANKAINNAQENGDGSVLN